MSTSWREVTIQVAPGLGETLAAALDVEERASVTPGDVVTVWFDATDEDTRGTLLRAFDAWCRRTQLEASWHERLVGGEWSRPFPAFRVGRVCLVDADAPRPALRDDDLVLPIVAGSAFGTGRHATTRTCLRLLQKVVKPGEVVLDAGCGTGVLGVAAVLCGAASATLFDDDELCVVATHDLAERAGVADRCHVSLASVPTSRDAHDALPPTAVDGLLANIEHEVILAGAPALAEVLTPGGWFVISGCRAETPDRVRPALEAVGLRVDAVHAAGTRFVAYSGRRVSTT